MTIKLNKQKYLFHPRELLFCGYSNAGKTTLLKGIFEKLSHDFKIAYAKHDVHQFAMDHKGKDTDIIMRAGAQAVSISDKTHWAAIKKGELGYFDRYQKFTDYDFVLVEGYKSLPLPKVLVLDSDLEILKPLELGEIENIKAVVGFSEERPKELLGDMPYFYRNDLSSICDFVLSLLCPPTMQNAPSGLILAGGYSTRMKKDKGKLNYFGKPQVEHLGDLLGGITDEVFISARAEQWPDGFAGSFPVIEDRFLNMGPMGGILSAMMAHPEKSWLVIACDLPLLNKPTLDYLLKNRDPLKLATAYVDENGLPEPLCAVYEARMKQRLWEALGLGLHCPRKVMLNSAVKMIKQKFAGKLTNINHDYEYDNFKNQINSEVGL